MARIPLWAAATLTLILALSGPASAEDAPIEVDGHTFATLSEYVSSEYFRAAGGRCGTGRIGMEALGTLPQSSPPSDCGSTSTTIDEEYDPSVLIELQVVFHVISSTGGSGDISDGVIEAQVAALNRDYLASHDIGADGTDGQIQFVLATVDPDGNATSGINRVSNDTWYNDDDPYYESLAWDPTRYVNIYTNCPGCDGGSAADVLGYTYLPQQLDVAGLVGEPFDRIVLWFGAVGDPGPAFPYDRGRTLTHEMGHYLGLYHTFEGGCGTASCYTTGDRICDTEAEAVEHYDCPASASSCGTNDPFTNYMDYSPDLCMTNFTPEQVNRMRCSIFHYRPDIYDVVVPTRSTTWTELKVVFGQ